MNAQQRCRPLGGYSTQRTEAKRPFSTSYAHKLTELRSRSLVESTAAPSGLHACPIRKRNGKLPREGSAP